MRIYCPTCGLDVAVTKTGKIITHGDGNATVQTDYGVRRPRPKCYSSGLQCLTDEVGHARYQDYERTRKETDPDFTYSGWLRHSRIHVLE